MLPDIIEKSTAAMKPEKPEIQQVTSVRYEILDDTIVCFHYNNIRVSEPPAAVSAHSPDGCSSVMLSLRLSTLSDFLWRSSAPHKLRDVFWNDKLLNFFFLLRSTGFTLDNSPVLSIQNFNNSMLK